MNETVAEGEDDIALGSTLDPYARTGLTDAISLTSGGRAVRSRHSLVIRLEAAVGHVRVDLTLPQSGGPYTPAQTTDKELANIALRYDRAMAELVALILEYPLPTRSIAAAP